MTALGSAQLRALTTTEIRQLETTQIAALLSSQLGMLQATAIAALTAAQLQAITTSQIAGLSAAQIRALPTGDITSLTATLISALTSADAVARSQLAGAGIAPDWQGRPVSTLSGGQKARLALLLLRLRKPNFYLLDEPTNHLDIDGQEALEAELAAQEAAALLVSHDRAFIRAVGTRFWQIDKARLAEVDSPEPFFQSQLQS